MTRVYQQRLAHNVKRGATYNVRRENKRARYAALEAWQGRNPGACTREFDGTCRCPRLIAR